MRNHAGWYYARVPALDLTTHGEGVDGAMAAAVDLVQGWVAEKRSRGEPVPKGISPSRRPCRALLRSCR